MGLAYGVTAVYLYSHVMADRSGQNGLLLFVYALVLASAVVPGALAVYVLYRSQVAKRYPITHKRFLVLAGSGAVMSFLVGPVFALGSARLEGLPLGFFLIAPAGPLLMFLSAKMSSAAPGTTRIGETSLFCLVALAPGMTLWFMAGTNPSGYLVLSTELSKLLAGSLGPRTVFLELAPFFVIYSFASALMIGSFVLTHPLRTPRGGISHDRV